MAFNKNGSRIGSQTGGRPHFSDILWSQNRKQKQNNIYYGLEIALKLNKNLFSINQRIQ
jgi:hypothetical protein